MFVSIIQFPNITRIQSNHAVFISCAFITKKFGLEKEESEGSSADSTERSVRSAVSFFG